MSCVVDGVRWYTKACWWICKVSEKLVRKLVKHFTISWDWIIHKFFPMPYQQVFVNGVCCWWNKRSIFNILMLLFRRLQKYVFHHNIVLYSCFKLSPNDQLWFNQFFFKKEFLWTVGDIFRLAAHWRCLWQMTRKSIIMRWRSCQLPGQLKHFPGQRYCNHDGYLMDYLERILTEVKIGMTLIPEFECHLIQTLLDAFVVAEGSVSWLSRACSIVT